MGAAVSCWKQGQTFDVPDKQICEVQTRNVTEVSCCPETALLDEASPASVAASSQSSAKRSIPISISSPDLGSLNGINDKDVTHLGKGFPTGPSRCPSMARMHSVKDAAKDSAMEAALRNFEAKIAVHNPPGRVYSAPEDWSSGIALHAQGRELSSAPEMFSDAAMRNALRKIATLQTKQVPQHGQLPRSQPPHQRLVSKHSAASGSTGDVESSPQLSCLGAETHNPRPAM